MMESFIYFVRIIKLKKQYSVYKTELISLSLIYLFLFSLILYVMTQRPELERMLEYSENVEINKLRKERSDLRDVSKEALLKKFHIIE